MRDNNDMIQMMTVGNQLYSQYSSLSLLARQSMLTELPEMVTVFERFFQLEYSESYTCKMKGDARIERYHYCMPLKMCISKHCHEVTGFLSWIRTYCISCVVH